MERFALAGSGGSDPADQPRRIDDADRIEVIVSLGAALAVNSVPHLGDYLAAATALDTSAAEVRDIAELATFIRGKAISRAERVLGPQTEAAA